jgi:hypothetical protein
MLPITREQLRQRKTKQLVRVILCVDADTTASGGQTATGLRAQDVEYDIRQHIDPGATRNAANEIEVDGGQTRVCLLRWEVADMPDPGLPDKQVLERLVTAAIVAAYPDRKSAVAS